jgi:hypothetical protein
MERTDFLAKTATGTVIRAFASRDLAISWSDTEGRDFPGHTISRVVQITTIRETVLRRDRSHLGAVA